MPLGENYFCKIFGKLVKKIYRRISLLYKKIPKSSFKYKKIIFSINSDSFLNLRNSPNYICNLFEQYKEFLIASLGNRFSDLTLDELEYVFCTIIAHSLAPYGPSKAQTFKDLLESDSYNCGNYGLLSSFLNREFTHSSSTFKIIFVGWDGGAIGNHQMLFLERTDSIFSLILDPTIGLIAKGNFNSVASGKKIPLKNMIVFNAREELESYRQNIIRCLQFGRFKTF